MINRKKQISVSEAKFPVSLVNVGEVTGFNVVNTERSQIVVGEFDDTKNILGIHSGRYSLISNEMLINTIEKVLMKFPATFEISVEQFRMMQFQIQVKFMEVQHSIGNQRDNINCSFVMKNGYDGKQKFGLHGVAMREKSKVKQAYYLSTYRQICTNGLHGWVDESVSFEQYIDLLRQGKKVKHQEVSFDQETLSQEELKYSHKHSGIDVVKFAQELENSIEALANLYQKAVEGASNTIKAYNEMAGFTPKSSTIQFLETIQKKAGLNVLPKNLLEPSLNIIAREQEKLNVDSPNAWLIYNGVNRALSDSVKSIVQRNAADELVFNAIAEEVFA